MALGARARRAVRRWRSRSRALKNKAEAAVLPLSVAARRCSTRGLLIAPRRPFLRTNARSRVWIAFEGEQAPLASVTATQQRASRRRSLSFSIVRFVLF